MYKPLEKSREKMEEFAYGNAARLQSLGNKLTYGAVGLGVGIPVIMKYCFGIVPCKES